MITQRPRIALLLTFVIVLGPPLSTAPIAQGANCAQIAERFEREVNALKADADQKNIAFLNAQAMADSAAALKTLLANSSSQLASDIQHAMDVKEKWEEVDAAYEKMTTYAEIMDEIWTCTRPDSTCNLQRLLNEVKAEVKAWLDSMGDASMTAIANRVAEARDMIRTHMNRAMNVSTGTMTAMANCTAPFVQRANASLSAAPATGAPPATPAEDGVPEVAEPPSAPVNGGGGGTGMLLGGLAAAGGALYGAQALGLLGEKCAAEAPNNYHEICENQGRNTNTCRALQDEYRVWCDCRKGTFSYQGGCR